MFWRFRSILVFYFGLLVGTAFGTDVTLLGPKQYIRTTDAFNKLEEWLKENHSEPNIVK